jgi:Fur family transcriptional regulator, ferric uptake regulator
MSTANRSTKQKRAIEAVLSTHANPLTALEIQQLAAHEVPNIGVATIYRSLKSLTQEGRVVCVGIAGQPPRYERADKAHHHHFLCNDCGRVFELERCVSNISTMAPHNFRVSRHEITLYGSCAICALK